MIRLMLLDDHALVRTGYRRMFDAEPDMKVVCDVSGADEACACLRTHEIDVALVDLSLRGASGIDAIARILQRDRSVRVLVLSMYDEPGFVRQAIRAGALGYLTKNCAPDELMAAVRAVHSGRRVLAEGLAHSTMTAAFDSEVMLERLTPREFEVLRFVASGDPVASIAESMHLSQKTVLNHLSAVRQKLGAENDFRLLHLAVRHGLVSLGEQLRA
ncbi:response regulator [Thauera mechernichensis]|mgnify:CR=1 FL=1|uniref:Response regulator n=1 Tax=Thauera mechernichensis TaxID=82788 RepID=A0ABW3WEP8_9RHOO|nr:MULTISPECIES: response regulator transcription factor [Thauera]MDG3063725.1 response regulator transcription factor [Thauera mechernichensis]WBL65559.1 response regulator transcription factor [Thauera sp. WB-2]HNR59729.1 response regulator transcription factor [Thauera sp.]HNS92463.1 response regulator transcription factor [Thauera sp.]HRJ23920.1 response regulator transcription factor [Thauera sp.]